MDPNLTKIAESNRYQIRHGDVKTAIAQAQDYLNYILFNDKVKVQQELDVFAEHVKNLRRRHRGKRKAS